jgi:ArsR family transcriptional regulator
MQFKGIQKDSLEMSSGLLRAIAHPLRISMMNFIMVHQPVKVHDIHTELNLEQSITSQHLRILRDAGVVHTSRDGKNIYYHIKSDLLTQYAHIIIAFDKKTLNSRKKSC